MSYGRIGTGPGRQPPGWHGQGEYALRTGLDQVLGGAVLGRTEKAGVALPVLGDHGAKKPKHPQNLDGKRLFSFFVLIVQAASHGIHALRAQA